MIVKNQSNGRCSWVCYIRTLHAGSLFADCLQAYSFIYISAWASALLVSTIRAMPEPLCVGRVTSLIPTLFFLSDKESKTAGRRESGLLGDFSMKQCERAGIMRIVSDIVKADSIIDLREIECLDRIREKYRITKEDEVVGKDMTLSNAACLLKDLPEGLVQDIIGDFYNLALSDKAFTREESFILLAIIACLSKKYSLQAEIYSTVLPNDAVVEKSQILYIEGEYYKEVNREISEAYREISNEFRLIGLNFVYLPKVSEHYKSLPSSKLLSLLSFLYPELSEKRMGEMIRQLTSLNTSDFCKEGVVGRMNLKGLEESLPSMLLCINESSVGGKTYANFLAISLEKDAISITRDFTDLFMRLYRPRVLNPIFSSKERFVYQGYYKQIFDVFTERKGVRSSVVIDLVRGDIFLPEAEIRLSKLHRREKALYALFLLESRSGGINFSKPDNAHALRKFDYRMQLIQLKYEMIYEGFGGNRANAPKICQSENRLPMLSLIKQQIRSVGEMLCNADDYMVQRNIFGNYSVAISSELCLCYDSEQMKICRMEDSDFWSRVSAL